MCQRVNEFSLGEEDCWESMELFEQEKEHNLLILFLYPSCNFDFSYFWLVFDFLQTPLLRLTTPAYTVAFGFASAQLAKYHLMQQQLANPFLLRRLTTPQ
jgi:hypothetical protein